jgi:choice-of-anchor A domain-containing protein
MSSCLVKAVSSVATFGVVLSLGTHAHAGSSLGVANDFNVFIFGDVTQNNTDAEGKVAIGGNANLTNYFAGMNLPNADTPSNALIVGKSLTFNGGQVKGNATYGTTATTHNLTLLNNGSLTQQDSSQFFSQAKSDLTTLSSSLSGLPAIAAPKSEFGKISLNGTDSAFNIFNVSGEDLSQANTLTIAAPIDSTVVVNVSGQSAKLQNMGFQLNGSDRQNVLYNFYEATELTASGVGIEGSVLAPKAKFNFNNGQLNGTVIADSLEGTGQMNVVYFKGELPDGEKPKEIPEPATAAALIGVGAIAGLLRRRSGTVDR